MNRTLTFLLGVLAAAAAVGLGLLLRGSGTDSGTFVTTPGEVTDARTGWHVAIDAGTGRHTLAQKDSVISPLWPMKPGWFVYLEDDARAWSFNGDDQLLLFVAGSGRHAGAYSPDTAPYKVPAPIVWRIGDARIRQLAANARTAKERLGIGPTP